MLVPKKENRRFIMLSTYFIRTEKKGGVAFVSTRGRILFNARVGTRVRRVHRG